MKKFAVRVFRLIVINPNKEEAEMEEGLQPMLGTFDNDRDAWASVTEPGQYVILPVCTYTVGEEETKTDKHGLLDKTTQE